MSFCGIGGLEIEKVFVMYGNSLDSALIRLQTRKRPNSSFSFLATGGKRGEQRQTTWRIEQAARYFPCSNSLWIDYRGQVCKFDLVLLAVIRGTERIEVAFQLMRVLRFSVFKIVDISWQCRSLQLTPVLLANWVVFILERNKGALLGSYCMLPG